MVAPLALMALPGAAQLAGQAIGTVASGLSALAGKAIGSKSAGSMTSDKAKSTSQDFEAMFLEQSLGTLTQSTGEDGPLGASGPGGGVYRSMLMKEYAGQIAKSGGVGIASSVYSQLMNMQEKSGG